MNKKQSLGHIGGMIVICGAVVAIDAASTHAGPANLTLSPAAQKEIASVCAEIDRTEAETLARIRRGSFDRSQQIILLGKAIFFDQSLSARQNESCAFCHMPETGFSGPISALNQTTAGYPGSVRTRSNGRIPQAHTYATFSPVLHYNAEQGDFVGGAFWDMRATGLRLNNPVAEQAQGPPIDPNEMGLIDPACMVYRMAARPYRSLAEQVWGVQAFAIRWPADVKKVCDRPGPAPASNPFPVHLAPVDRGNAQSTFDRIAQAIATY